MRFKEEKKKTQKRKSFYKRIVEHPWVKGLLIVLLIGLSFFGGAYAHKLGYTAKLRSLFGIVKSGVSDVAEVVENDIALYTENGLLNVYIDLPFESQEALRIKREEALEIGILNVDDEDFVPASIQLEDGDKIDVDLRLKGDWSDHYAGDKWSLRIEIDEEDKSFMGMTRFSLQEPGTREFLNEWGYHQNLIQEGILTTRYHFVNVIINGEYKGIYAVEESFTEELLESQGHREGIILKFDEDDMWANWSTFREVGGESFMLDAQEAGTFLVMDDDSADITIFRSGRVAANEMLEAEAETAINLLRSFQKGDLTASEVFDVDKLGTFFAITDLWAANHGTAWHNIRFYYNPVTALLEPVAYDANPLTYYSVEVATFPYSIPTMFDDPQIQEAYLHEVERITNEQYLIDLRESLEPDFLVYQEALSEEYDSGLDAPWDRLEKRQTMLEINLNPDNAVRGGFKRVWVNGEKYLQVDLVNQMILPVQVQTIIIEGNETTFLKDWFEQTSTRVYLESEYDLATMRPGHSTVYEPYRFLIPYDWTEPVGEGEEGTFSIQVVVNLLGGSQSSVEQLAERELAQGLEESPRPIQPTTEEFLEAHPYIQKIDEETLLVQPGMWDVIGDLVLPDGVRLVIPEGTSLFFEEQSVLFATAPISIYGSEENPVKLTSKNESWGGVVVLSADERSLWRYVTIENMGGIARDGWVLTGGITFFESAVTLQNVHILNTTSEDAINVIQSEFTFTYSEFANTASDAFDGDFTEGTITNCSFHDIVGDGVDVSGSDVTIESTTFFNVSDKAISVGEDSEVDISDALIKSVGIGVASKDLSEVTISDSTISLARVAALAAYTKKPVFGPAQIIVTHVTIASAEYEALVQTDSVIVIDGEEMPTVDLDIDSLYEQGILGN